MGKTTNMLDAVKIAYKALDDKFGKDITILNISKLSTLSDYFIIAEGNNPNQVKAMADEVDMQLGKAGIFLKHSEGRNTANWILLDFGDIIVHVFDKESRSFYNLERIWGDAEVLNIKLLPQQ